MKLLFVHQNFPGQFKSLAPAMAAMEGVSVASLSMQAGGAPSLPKIRSVVHQPSQGSTPNLMPFVGDFETKMLRAASAARAALKMRDGGFSPI